MQPEMYARNDIQVRVGAQTGAAFANVAYSPVKHLYVVANTHGWANETTNMTFGEFGIGAYGLNQDKGGYSISVMGGYGTSTVYNRNWRRQFDIDAGIETNYLRFSIQPGIYTKIGRNASLVSSFRTSMVQWNNVRLFIDDNVDLGGVPHLDMYIEPALTLTFGNEFTRFFFGGGLEIPLHRSFIYNVIPIHLSCGMHFYFQPSDIRGAKSN